MIIQISMVSQKLIYQDKKWALLLLFNVCICLPKKIINSIFRSGVPIPNRNERTSSLSFGTSPSAALTSHLISYGDSKKTPSEESPYLVMSPVDPDKEFSTSKIPVKLRTASIDSTGTTSSSGTRPKTNRRFTRGQSDSQRSSLCFDDHWNDLGISPQDSSGGTLMGPDCTDYAPLHSAGKDSFYISF